MLKKHLGVIFGGLSTEYEVSLASATFILENIDLDKYELTMIGISKKGDWFLYEGDIKYIKTNQWLTKKYIKPITISLNPNKKGIYILEHNNKITFKPIDIIFPVLHGRNGEDGSIQGLFKIAGIPFVGCDYVSSAICMDKELTHTILESNNIKTAPWIALNKYEFENSNFDILEEEYKLKLGYPMFIKPANAGSSVGVSKAKNKLELLQAINNAYKIDKKIIIEGFVSGKEIECAVIGNNKPFASILGEISPSNDFYDYNAKYNNQNSLLYIPAKISEENSDKIREIAKKAFKVLGCSGMARIDFFLTANNDIILNEPNTIPGFTAISMYPKLLMNSGLEKKEIINNLLELGFEYYNENSIYNNIS